MQQLRNKPMVLQQLRCVGALSALLVGVQSVHAIDLMPDFSTLPTDWTTDRYEPHSFSNVGPFQGRTDVLGIEITSAEGAANRPGGQQGGFYNTQGRKYAISGGASDSIAADLWIPEEWRDSAGGSIRTDIWGTMWNGTAITAYPILGFANFGGTPRFRAWDADTASGWLDLSATVNYGAWNALEILFSGNSFDYYVNGSLAYSDATIGTTTGFKEVIMQAYNFYDASLGSGYTPVDYTAHWSNQQGASVPDGVSTVTLLGLSLAGLLSLRRRIRA